MNTSIDSIQWIDSHAHLHLIEKRSFQDILSFCKEKRIFSIINVSTDINSYKENKKRSVKGIHLSIGIYPSYSQVYSSEMKKSMLFYLKKDPKIIGIGECGIDHYRNYGKDQATLFQDQVHIAKEFNKPLIIHIRNAFEEVYKILKSSNILRTNGNGVIHCYTGNIEFMKKFIDLGFYISLSGIVTFKNAMNLQKVALEIPLDSLLLETDSPYLTPIPHRGKENQPGYLPHTGEFIANLMKIPIQVISKKTFKNTCKLFNLSEKKDFLI